MPSRLQSKTGYLTILDSSQVSDSGMESKDKNENIFSLSLFTNRKIF